MRWPRTGAVHLLMLRCYLTPATPHAITSELVLRAPTTDGPPQTTVRHPRYHRISDRRLADAALRRSQGLVQRDVSAATPATAPTTAADHLTTASYGSCRRLLLRATVVGMGSVLISDCRGAIVDTWQVVRTSASLSRVVTGRTLESLGSRRRCVPLQPTGRVLVRYMKRARRGERIG